MEGVYIIDCKRGEMLENIYFKNLTKGYVKSKNK